LSNSRRDATAAVSAGELTLTNGEEDDDDNDDDDDDNDDNDGDGDGDDDESENVPFCPSSTGRTPLPSPSFFPLIIDKSVSLVILSVGLSNTIAGLDRVVITSEAATSHSDDSASPLKPNDPTSSMSLKEEILEVQAFAAT
jgi:hypothetical protein